MTSALGDAGSVGAAYANFHLNTSTADADLRKGLDKASKDGEKIATDMGNKFGATFVKEAGTEIEKTAGKEFLSKFSKSMGNESVKVKVNVDVDVDRDSATRAAGKISRALSGAFSKVSGSFVGDIFGVLGGGIKSLGSSVGNVGSNGPFAGIVGFAILYAIPAIVGAIGALLNVLLPLVNVLFFLPALLGTVAAAIVPVIVGFQGFGTALSTILNSDDPEEIKKAFESISKSAGKVATEIKAAMPALHELRMGAQESLFQGFVGVVPRLVDALLPSLKVGFDKVNVSFGHFVDNLVKVFEDPRMQRFIDGAFNAAAFLFDTLGGPFNRFLLALADVGVVTLPHLENFITYLGGLMDRFSGWLKTISENGQLEGFIDKLKVAFDSFMLIAASGWNLVKAIIGGTGEDGRALEFINAMVSMIDVLTEFFESDIGKESLKGMVVMGEVLLAVLLGIVGAWSLMGFAIEYISKAIAWVIDQIVKLAGAISNAANRMSDLASRIPIIGTIGRAIGGLSFNAAGDIFDRGAEAVIVGEAGPEVLLPLNNPARTRELAAESGLMNILGGDGGGGGIIFGPGAIQVNFNGQLPSQQQAYGAGQQVADGISSVLSRRDTRAAIRAM